MHEDGQQSVLSAAATLMGMVAVIGILQVDGVAKLLVSPEQLHERRRREQVYRMERTLSKLKSKQWPEEDQKRTEFLYEDETIDEVVDAVLASSKEAAGKESAQGGLKIVAIIQNEDDVTDRDYYLVLSFASTGKLVQVPMIKFCTRLADKMENIIFTNTLCFIADATSGLGTQILAAILQDACQVKPSASEDKLDAASRRSASKDTVALIQEPYWMLALASILSQHPGIMSRQTCTKIVTALCRLDAARIQHEVGETSTVVFTLPGQSVTPQLLPLLQAAFPCERHVFVYDNAVSSVRRATTTSPPLAEQFSTEMLLQKKTSASVALHPLTHIKTLPKLLSTLSPQQAAVCETWMSSVDAFLRLKDDEKNNGYLPFVLRLQHLYGCTSSVDRGVTAGDLLLNNVLQYVLGARSRPIHEHVLTTARTTLVRFRDMEEDGTRGGCSPMAPLSTKRWKEVEDCVFAHKSILIADKTLLDTVQPAEHWTLKAARKALGCACCAPEEEEEEEEEGQKGDGSGAGGETGTGSAQEAPMTFGLTQRKVGGRPKYVDGKNAFAFDPSAFSKPAMVPAT